MCAGGVLHLPKKCSWRKNFISGRNKKPPAPAQGPDADGKGKRCYSAVQAAVELGQLPDLLAQCGNQGLVQPPLPVALLGAGGVDAPLSPKMQPVRQRNDGGVRYTGQTGADHAVRQLVWGAAQILTGQMDVLRAGVFSPGFGGDIVMGAGVYYAVRGIGVGQVVAGFPAVKGKLHDLHTGCRCILRCSGDRCRAGSCRLPGCQRQTA